MKNNYGDNIRLLFTDTDSLMYEICTDDFYHDMWGMKENFDLASSPKTSTFYDGTNNKLVGKFKDEANGDTIVEIVRLRAKMKSSTTLNRGADNTDLTTKKRANWLKRAAVAKLRHHEFKAQLNHP